jgi:hypothetical protein
LEAGGISDENDEFFRKNIGRIVCHESSADNKRTRTESSVDNTTSQVNNTVLSANESTLATLGKLGKISTHNPQWRLNRNWDLLNGILIDLGHHLLRRKMARENEERHNQSLKRAEIRVDIYQEAH